jgi:hypothetical protein
MKFHDRVRETTTTTGTGDITLAGVFSSQFQLFSSVYIVGELVPYAIVGQSGSEWETGLGTLTSSTTIQRTFVYESSNSNSLVNFSSGTKDIFATIPAFFMSRIETMGHTLAKSLGYDMP